ncbi:unnamed protein product [Phytomonas sp. EM1]|nr:unnamed protein product [Phytomonas sp. EM1]|eukprot:CCW61041.1 unnamed protein product [Phytomonas sp. isolate EM1]
MILVYSSIDIDVLSFDRKLLIGQLSETLCDGNTTVFNYVIFDGVPIKNNEVIVEQIECLEGILPPGLVVLGATSREAYNSSSITNLLSVLSESIHFSEFIYMQLDNSQLHVTLCSDPGVCVTFKGQGGVFCTLSCAVHLALPPFPFLLMRSGDMGEKILIDPQSTKRISVQMNSEGSWSLHQLGGNSFHTEKTMLVFSAFLSLPYLSGNSFYNCIDRWMRNIKKTTDIISVQSQRNPSLIYACQFDRCIPFRSRLTQVEWHELQELLEDATGELIKSSQLIGLIVTPNPACERGEMPPRNKESNKFMLIITIGLVVLAIMITILMRTW